MAPGHWPLNAPLTEGLFAALYFLSEQAEMLTELAMEPLLRQCHFQRGPGHLFGQPGQGMAHVGQVVQARPEQILRLTIGLLGGDTTLAYPICKETALSVAVSGNTGTPSVPGLTKRYAAWWGFSGTTT